jgi:excisionase family DNA binding protein
MHQLTFDDSLAVEPENRVETQRLATLVRPLAQSLPAEEDPPHVPASWDRPTLTIAEAGRYLGLSRTAAYRAATSGHIPTIRTSEHRFVVPTAAFRTLLGLPPEDPRSVA